MDYLGYLVTHYWHNNITYGVSTWPDKENKTRHFDTVREMSQAVVNSINKYVKENDELYFLGDWSFGGIENIYNFWKQLICKNIYFISGNHDQNIKKNKALPNCTWGHHYKSIEEWHPTEDEPVMEDEPVYAQDLFNMLPDLTTITYEKQLIVLSHYPIDQWENMKHGSIMLHGHCHHTIDNCETNMRHRRMDVGIDWEEFRPYSIDEIVKIMNKRNVKNI